MLTEEVNVEELLKQLPRKIQTYIKYATRRGSKTRRELILLLHKIQKGERITWYDIKSKPLKNHIMRLRRLNYLILIKDTAHYFKINPELT